MVDSTLHPDLLSGTTLRGRAARAVADEHLQLALHKATDRMATQKAAGVQVVETDLGEWIIQLARETPSHIIAPAIHKTRGDVAELFSRLEGGDLSDVPAELCHFAHDKLRERFLDAEMGISGVNFGI